MMSDFYFCNWTISESDKRFAQAPDIPTFSEMGLRALSDSLWFGLFAPRGTSPEIGRLNAAAVAALATMIVPFPAGGALIALGR